MNTNALLVVDVQEEYMKRYEEGLPKLSKLGVEILNLAVN